MECEIERVTNIHSEIIEHISNKDFSKVDTLVRDATHSNDKLLQVSTLLATKAYCDLIENRQELHEEIMKTHKIGMCEKEIKWINGMIK